MKKPEQRSLNRAALALFFKLMIALQKIFADLTQKRRYSADTVVPVIGGIFSQVEQISSSEAPLQLT